MVSRQMSRIICENAEVARNQAEYNTWLRTLEAFMHEQSENGILIAFGERVFLGTTEKITVSKGQRKRDR